MLPAATIVHDIPGRLRVRVEERRRDDAYFAHAAEQLRQCPGVVEVTVTPMTASVLVLHDGAGRDVVADYARAFELFDVAAQAALAPDADLLPGQIVRERLRDADRWVRRHSDDRTDLRSLALVGLLAGAAWQIVRGHVLPAGATLLWYALALTRERGPIAGPEVDEIPSTPRLAASDPTPK
jgi:hypothetical protein